MLRFQLVLSVFFVVGCSTDVFVSREMFGDAWPLTVTSGVLDCQNNGPRKLVTIDVDGIMYALNGSAKSFGFPDVTTIRRRVTIEAGLTQYVPLEPLIQRGLTLCR
jgi:hypothetical protein